MRQTGQNIIVLPLPAKNRLQTLCNALEAVMTCVIGLSAVVGTTAFVLLMCL